MNIIASYSLRVLVILHWIFLAAFWNLSPTVGQQAEFALAIFGIYVPVALIFISILVDWFTRKDEQRHYSKLIDTSLWGVWLISMLCLVVYSLAMGTL